MGGISLVKANFLALILESFVYGAFNVLFFAALYVVVIQRSVINYRLLSTLMAIWLLSTTHWILDIIRAVDAFVEQKDGGPSGYYGNLSNPLQATKTAVYVLLTVVGDSFVIYRCYIVWGQKWWIVPIPVFLLCGTATTGIGATIGFSRTPPGENLFLATLVPWITGFISMTFATNTVCTLLIAFRVQRIRSNLKNVYYSSIAQSTVIMFIESAAIYASAILSLLISYSLGSNFQYTVLDMTSPLIGVTFTIIILRVSMGISSRQLTTVATTSPESGRLPESVKLRNQSGAVAVNVSRLIETDKGGEDTSTYKHSPVAY